ncbi:hypothetical protein CS542_02575 [Pedobacter sp. IW39]|nr:hypothetical protein CS542_02575 [Pedobacter sp. IW39]
MALHLDIHLISWKTFIPGRDSFKDNMSSGLTIKTLAITKDIARFKAQVLLNNYDKLKEKKSGEF